MDSPNDKARSKDLSGDQKSAREGIEIDLLSMSKSHSNNFHRKRVIIRDDEELSSNMRKAEVLSDESNETGDHSQFKTDILPSGIKVFDGSRRKVFRDLIDRRGSSEDVEVDGENQFEFSSVASEPDRDGGGLEPIKFYCILPAIEENREEAAPMYPLEDLSLGLELGMDWKQCLLATGDLRLMENLATCHVCLVNRPGSIFMPCGHGGMCLRCAIKHANVQKLCPYCGKVKIF